MTHLILTVDVEFLKLLLLLPVPDRRERLPGGARVRMRVVAGPELEPGAGELECCWCRGDSRATKSPERAGTEESVDQVTAVEVLGASNGHVAGSRAASPLHRGPTRAPPLTATHTPSSGGRPKSLCNLWGLLPLWTMEYSYSMVVTRPGTWSGVGGCRGKKGHWEKKGIKFTPLGA